MKVILEFSPHPDNSDAFELFCAQNGNKYHCALGEIAARIRARLKYEDPSDEERATLEALRELIPNLDQP